MTERSWKVWRDVWTRNGVDRVHCWRRDIASSGDLWVIAWKPLNSSDDAPLPATNQ